MHIIFCKKNPVVNLSYEIVAVMFPSGEIGRQYEMFKH